MAYITEWENRGVYWKYEGIVSGSELLRSNMDIYGDPRFDNMRYQIVDLTAVEHINVTAEDIQKIAACDEAAAISNPHVKVAVVAINTKAKALAALYANESAESPWQMCLFDTVEQARTWIDNCKTLAPECPEPISDI